MAGTPKRKLSTRRQGKRRSSIKLMTLKTVKCPHCQKTKISHRTCPHCKN